ncbi:MAG TPA: monofunctional biosynthetic peptidoglycan transglycosylase [Acidobacteriota bacterium]|nr:monofunctional biosynthetic peptidoglycan transglycosylase [Acidobacteriota bacterium]
MWKDCFKKGHRRRTIVILLCTMLAVFIGYEFITYPDVAVLAKENPKSTAWMEMRDRESRAEGKKPRRYQIWMPIQSISADLKNAVLIAEDAAFFQHEGLDYGEIREAIKINAEKMEFARGASTITQQLAKNLYLSPSRNPFRKIKEIFLTFSLERHVTKRRIFEIYLNVIEWGDGVYGAEAAARRYYGKSCSELSREEAAALAAVIINPRRYSPINPNKRIHNRIAMIQARMEKYRYYKN